MNKLNLQRGFLELASLAVLQLALKDRLSPKNPEELFQSKLMQVSILDITLVIRHFQSLIEPIRKLTIKRESLPLLE